MPCPTCGTENPAEANFCYNCGTDLRIECPNCTTINVVAAKFCINCGHSLQEITGGSEDGPARREQPARLRSADGERRIVSILFVDVSGSTSLAEQMDPEEWTEIINAAFKPLIAAVTRYDGTVARLLGDGILALFGAPTAHEDDAFRAVLAGLDMLKNFAPFRKATLERLDERGVLTDTSDFQIRIGISTGLVVVGVVGSGDSVEYTAMGDAVNLAARMEETAAPGTLQITYDTYRLIEGLVDAAALGEVALKGKNQPVRVYRVNGLKPRRQHPRGLSALKSTLIGRHEEINRLHAGLERLEHGQGQIISLIGDAGLGKSRLLSELRDRAAGMNLVWVEVASLSYEGDHAYGLIRQLLRRVCDCSPDDPPEMVREQILSIVSGVEEAELAAVEAALETLLTLRLGSAGDLSGERMQEAIYRGVETIWKKRTNSAPTVTILEDLHWADPASVDLIRHLFELTNRAPILFLCVFRPNRRSGAWSLKQHAESDFPHRYEEIVLSPLSAEESNQLVKSLMEAVDLPSKVVNLVLDKAEGNPFFVEELVGELIESGAVVRSQDGNHWETAVPIDDVELPESLEALLVARMDRLEENARQTLQMAAVIGRTFYFRVLKMVSEGMDYIEEHLATLERSGLIREAQRIPELEYMFRHVLTQEAAYNTMLRKRRKVFHQRTGEVIETLFSERLEEQAALLAHHYYRAGNEARALHYAGMAAEHADRLHASLEAVAHYNKALEIADAAGASPQERIHLLRGRAASYEKLGDFQNALTDLEAGLAIARDTDTREDDWQILINLGQLWTSRDYERAGRYYEESLALARDIGRPERIAQSLNRIGNWHANAERPVKGIGFHREALDLLVRAPEDHEISVTMDLLGMANHMAGNFAAGGRVYREVIQLFEQNDDRYGLISALTTLAYRGPNTRTAYLDESLETASKYGEKALGLTRKIGWLAGESYACFALGSTMSSLGNFDRALELCLRGLEVAEEIQHRQWMAASEICLGTTWMDLMKWETALAHQERGLALGHEVNSKNWIFASTSWAALCCLKLGDVGRAEALLQQIAPEEPGMSSLSSRVFWAVSAQMAVHDDRPDEALNILDDLSAGQDWPEGAVVTELNLLRAVALEKLDDLEAALRTARAGAARAKETRERVLEWRLNARIGRLLGLMGHKDDALDAFQLALDQVEQLAARISDNDLRDHFLQKSRASMEV